MNSTSSTTSNSTPTMESIEEQWFLPLTSDITSKSWVNIADAKKAVKTWILDRGESWAPTPHNDKTRLLLHCLSKSCSFHIRLTRKKDSLFWRYCLHSSQLS